ncbi:MAG: hypothetical protein V4793_48295, partial [Paraburkholderia tropica]
SMVCRVASMSWARRRSRIPILGMVIQDARGGLHSNYFLLNDQSIKTLRVRCGAFSKARVGLSMVGIVRIVSRALLRMDSSAAYRGTHASGMSR